VKHLGDITKIDWSQVEPVDVVAGGSPCQDLSAAGKRKGLAGERSGLFMEQIRCVKELRKADELRGRTDVAIRPRYMVWENVPGAFSSNKKQDFRAVLEETVRVICQECPDVPGPPRGGWSKSGCLYDEMGRWSVAWRLHDAQFWGVPQRRKRISLVADFGGLSAPEILFERKGLSGNIEPGGPAGEKTAGGTGKRTENSGGRYTLCLNDQGGDYMDVSEEIAGTLRAQNHGHASIVAGFKHKAGAKAGNIGFEIEKAPTLNAATTAAAFDARGNGDGKIVPTITGDHEGRITDYTEIVMATGQGGAEILEDVSPTLNCDHENPIIFTPAVAAVDCRNMTENPDVNGTLQAKSNGGFSYNLQNVCRQGALVRRLTPMECERLQGFPDGWTSIGAWRDSKGKKRKETDTPRYKALGNSIARPFWKWLLKRISAQYEREATLGSLFDGIGGFPLCWEEINGKGSARWASEIEEFPIAVTKVRFPEETEGNMIGS